MKMALTKHPMIRKLVNHRKLPHEISALLIETYPHGYGDRDIISFRNLQGEIVEAVEISKSLVRFIADFDDNLEKEMDLGSLAVPAILEEGDTPDYELEDRSMDELDITPPAL
jgi:hypothetical protein